MMKNNELREKTKEVIMRMDELMNCAVSKINIMDTVRYSEPEDMVMLKSTVEAYDLSKELMEDYAKKLDEIDQKLDQILEKLKNK